MTTLYRPVLIESDDQARRLPDGAILIDQDYGILYERSGDDWSDPEGFGIDATGNSVLALVPVEAEEETRLHIVRPGARTTTADLARLVTAWEAVS